MFIIIIIIITNGLFQHSSQPKAELQILYAIKLHKILYFKNWNN